MAIEIKLTGDELKKSKRPKMDVYEALLVKHLESTGIHSQSDLNKIKPDPENPTPATFKELRKNFREFCKTESSLGDNFNNGMYIDLNRMEEIIKEFKAKASHLFIGLGLRKSKITEDVHDWNCFHLIFGAATPSTKVVTDSNGQDVGQKPTQKSDLWYSTYDGAEQGYTGSKPGCPPFSCPEE